MISSLLRERPDICSVTAIRYASHLLTLTRQRIADEKRHRRLVLPFAQDENVEFSEPEIFAGSSIKELWRRRPVSGSIRPLVAHSLFARLDVQSIRSSLPHTRPTRADFGDSLSELVQSLGL